MTRFYGRAKLSNRCVDKSSHGHWKTTTMLSAIWYNGKTETVIFDGSTTKEIFIEYIRTFIVPNLKKDDIVVMDNLSAHKNNTVRELIESKKANVMYLPPYSPDLNPIEMMWSKVKAKLRKLKARTIDELNSAIGIALNSVTPQDSKGWFEHAGYKA